MIPVNSNAAYEQVTLKRIEVQENSAYSVINTVPDVQYQNIVGVHKEIFNSTEHEYDTVDFM